MIEGLILILHVLGFVAVLVPLVCLAPHGSAASVFQTALNEGGWPTQGLAYCVGFIGNVATFVGMKDTITSPWHWCRSQADNWTNRCGCRCACKACQAVRRRAPDWLGAIDVWRNRECSHERPQSNSNNNASQRRNGLCYGNSCPVLPGRYRYRPCKLAVFCLEIPSLTSQRKRLPAFLSFRYFMMVSSPRLELLRWLVYLLCFFGVQS